MLYHYVHSKRLTLLTLLLGFVTFGSGLPLELIVRADPALAESPPFPISIVPKCSIIPGTSSWQVTNTTNSSRNIELFFNGIRTKLSLRPLGVKSINSKESGAGRTSIRIRVAQKNSYTTKTFSKRARGFCASSPAAPTTRPASGTPPSTVFPVATAATNITPSVTPAQPTATPTRTSASVSPTSVATNTPRPNVTPTVTTRPTSTTPPATVTPTRTATPTHSGAAQLAPIILDGRAIDTTLLSPSTENGRTKYTILKDLSFRSTGIIVAQPNVILDLNGKTIRFNSVDAYGAAAIYAFRYLSSEKWGLDARQFPEIVNLTKANGSGLSVRNGRIIWEGSSLANSPGAYATGVLTTADAGTVTVENVRFVAGGRDGGCVYAAWTSLTIRDSWCENSTTSTENRHQIPASVKAAGKVVAERNVILGGNNALFVGENSIVRYNILRPSGFDTNGYGIHTYKTSGSTFSQNIIVPSMGRGIMFNGGTDPKGNILTVNNQAFDNLLVSREAPNAEFGDNLNATTLRMRYDTNNNAFYSNICFAFGGGQYAAASGIYLSNAPSPIGSAARVNMFFDNTLVAFLVDDPAKAQNPFRRYANGITLEKQGLEGNPSKDRISNNRIYTNSYGLRFSGYDGYAYQHIMDNNEIRQVDGNAVSSMVRIAFEDPRFSWPLPSTNSFVTATAVTQLKQQLQAEVQALVAGKPSSWASRPYFPIHTAFYQASEAWLIATKLASGAQIQASDIMVENFNEGPTRLVIGHELRIRVTRNNQLFANGALEILNSGTIVAEVTTDAQGTVSVPIADYDLQRSRGVAAFQKTARSASSIRAKGSSASVALPVQPSATTAQVNLPN